MALITARTDTKAYIANRVTVYANQTPLTLHQTKASAYQKNVTCTDRRLAVSMQLRFAVYADDIGRCPKVWRSDAQIEISR
jgi:hypothetical protein